MASRNAPPDVVIGGAPRSGTTFVAKLLAKHPGIFLASPIIPEPKVCLYPHPRGDAGHVEQYRQLFSTAPAGAVCVEKTSNYFENDLARERLARVLPDTKFVFILREPVSRAYSNWKWSTKNKLETLPFAEAVELEGKRANPLGADREAARPFDYMLRGRYGTFAAAWYTRFGVERVRFFLFEDAIRHPARFVRELQEWIGVSALPWSDLRTDKVNATDPEPIGLDPALAETLRARIYPEVETFARITGLDLSVWDEAR
jgi:hypothetical protein